MKISRDFIRYFRDYKFNSLLMKNVRLLLLLLVVPLAGAAFVSYYVYDSSLRREIRTVSEETTSGICADLESVLKEARTELTYMELSTDVDLFLYDEYGMQYNYSVNNIVRTLRMPVLVKDYVESVYIYSLRGSRVVGLAGVADYETFYGKEMMDAFLGQEERNIIIAREGDEGGYSRKYLTLFQMIGYGNQLRGAIMMNLNSEELLEELSVPEDVRIYLTDGEEILFSSDLDLVEQSVDAIPGYDRLVRNGVWDDRDIAMSSETEDIFGLRVITGTVLGEYHSRLGVMRNVIISMLLLMLMMTFGLSIVISVRLYHPIGQIVSAFQEYDGAPADEKAPFTGKDELEYILNSIERTRDVRKNVEKELVLRVRLLKKAQAVALQSQINPHFLNNTLETINWMALEQLGRHNEISEMVGSLSKMLRMSMENTDVIVPVRAEVEHCEYYLDIQRRRYEDKFRVVWKIPSEIMDCKIIRIVLQPLVENAIYHGVKRISGKGLITISGALSEEGEQVELMVSDNGPGMTRTELEGLRKSMQGDMIQESRHIGVTNVNQRLRLYFGEEYGLTVDSRENVGTVVTIRFPRIR